MVADIGVISVLLDRGRTWLERRRYATYDRVVGFNYKTRLVATPKRTPGGWIWTYELYNRHGRHEMLHELSAYCDSDTVVYDIGANVGVYAITIAAGSPGRRVIAYEPAPPTSRRLQANCERNDCSERVTIRRVGLGDVSESQQFYVSTYPELSSFNRDSATRWGATIAETDTIPVRRLDDEIRDYPAPDVLKIDAEGTEPAVLRGARETLRSHRPAVFLEVHEAGHSDDYISTLRGELEAVDYTITEENRYWRCEPSE